MYVSVFAFDPWLKWLPFLYLRVGFCTQTKSIRQGSAPGKIGYVLQGRVTSNIPGFARKFNETGVLCEYEAFSDKTGVSLPTSGEGKKKFKAY